MDAVKFADGSDVEIVGPGIPYGGLFAGRDLDRQYFSAKTEFNFEWFTERPLLYGHGLEDGTGTDVVGRVKSWEARDDGVWVRAQLDKQAKYFSAIKDLVDRGALYFSSGAMAHLVKVNEKSGEIQRWPWVELSLTPTPSNLLATVDLATADKHYKAAGLELPDAVKAPMMADQRNALDDSDFAYIDSAGGRHLPMNDEAHCRAALSRFGQTTFESTDARDKAWVKLVKRCKELGVDVAAKSAEIKQESYEDLIESLQRLVNPFNPFQPPDCMSEIEATFPDYVIVERKQQGECTYWRIPYKLDANGDPVLGTPTEVEETYVPVRNGKSLPETSFTTQAQTVNHFAVTLSERTKDLADRRVKEGRVLSAASRTSLTECVASMRTAADQLQGFLDATDPARAKAKADLDALMVDIALLDFGSVLN